MSPMQLPQQHAGVPHAGLHAFLQICLERAQFARLFRAQPVNRCAFRMNQILADRLPVVAGQPAYRTDA